MRRLSRTQMLLLLAAAVLLAAAAAMPSGWYDALPRNPELPRPGISGVTLLRLALLMDAVVLIAFAVRWRVRSGGATAGFLPPRIETEVADLSARTTRALLVAVTALAFALRVYRLDADLWLDEITPILDYAHMPVLQIVGSYLRSNNHLLNTLGIKLAIAVAGENEWAVRLPAVLLGVLSIPALYWCARLAFSRRASLGAALLLAVSYHHVFFSQNARGYTGYILFALLSTRFFIQGLYADRVRDWVLYVLSVVLGVAALLNTAFVVAGHAVVGLVACVAVQRAGGHPRRLAMRLLGVFIAAGFLSLQLYAVALPDIYIVITNVYANAATGFRLFSTEFVREMIRGVSVGFGTGAVIAAVPFAIAAIAGWMLFVRRNWPLALSLTLPGVITATFLVVRNLSFSPRFFLLWLPMAILSVVAGVEDTLDWTARRRARAGASPSWRVPVGTALIALLALASLASLRRYYDVPKQPYRAAVRAVERLRGPHDLVVVLYTARDGMRYYGARLGAPVDSQYRFVRSVAAFDSAEAGVGARQLVLVSTFERALRLELPELYGRVEREWTVVERLPATVGDGDIKIWEHRSRARASD